jgi:hypothetical protein
MKKKQIKILGGVPPLRKGDKLKIHVYPKPKVNPDNFMMLGKVTEPSGKPIKKNQKHRVHLHLSRKDAQYLYLTLLLPIVVKEFTVKSEQQSRNRILNKLKREGIK